MRQTGARWIARARGVVVRPAKLPVIVLKQLEPVTVMVGNLNFVPVENYRRFDRNPQGNQSIRRRVG